MDLRLLKKNSIAEKQSCKNPIGCWNCKVDRNNFKKISNNKQYQVNNRPEIALSVSILYQHVSQPMEEDWLILLQFYYFSQF